MNIVEFPTPVEIQAHLRKLADAIDNGDFGLVRSMAMVLEADDTFAFAVGDCDSIRAAGLFSAGIATLFQQDDLA